ncbi:hypothetical protein [Actinomadura kijaniata]|uniref:hypothetical protein n=1 Tax=Actinomadura kijaniata TaxID=46161 RepID=UPI000A521F10|nr:hypothetical protein [Actinomadura kijaniata]
MRPAFAHTQRIRQLIDAEDDGPLGGLARLIAESAGSGAVSVRSPNAGWRPWRPASPRYGLWHDNVEELVRTRTDDPDAAEAFVALADGLCTATLLDGYEADPNHIRVILSKALLPTSHQLRDGIPCG